MTEPLNLDLNLNAQDYINQAGQALSATQQLDGGLRNLAVTTAGMQRVFAAAGPSPQHTQQLVRYGQAAAMAQYQLSGLAATQTVTHQSATALAGGMRQLARDIPIGNAAAQQLVSTVTQLGIVGDRSVQKIVAVSRAAAQLQRLPGLDQWSERHFHAIGLHGPEVRHLLKTRFFPVAVMLGAAFLVLLAAALIRRRGARDRGRPSPPAAEVS